jgi:D-alanyl-D-alanine carboxypeptidase/D-alanyl-D-alanine-endopeptidase (penicillin-binding protein 4)
MIGTCAAYAVADARDLVPGWLTDDAVTPPPAQIPSAVVPDPVPATEPVVSMGDDAPIPAAAAVQALANQLRDDSRMRSSTGISVVDLITGEVLASVRSSDPRVPASNDKILTAVAVTEAISGDRRLRTSVTWSGVAEDGVATVTLVAGGDMLLSANYGHGGTISSPNGYAGLADLADTVAETLTNAGVTTVNLVVDDHAFGGPVIPQGWGWSAVTHGYCSPPSGLAVDVGIVPGTRSDDENVQPERYLDPSLATADAFSLRLREHGFDIGTVVHGVANAAETEVAFVESAPIGDVVSYMMWYSDNTIAEVLLKVLALDSGLPGSTEAGVSEAVRRLGEAGLDTTGIVMTDGSGYSSTNRIPPRALTDLMVLLARDPDHDDLLEQFPVGALRGTLYDRFHGTEGAGVVRAKTGSLSGVTALSGTVVTADGRWLAFSVLADGLPWGQTKPRAAIDEFVTRLASCGCG